MKTWITVLALVIVSGLAAVPARAGCDPQYEAMRDGKAARLQALSLSASVNQGIQAGAAAGLGVSMYRQEMSPTNTLVGIGVGMVGGFVWDAYQRWWAERELDEMNEIVALLRESENGKGLATARFARSDRRLHGREDEIAHVIQVSNRNEIFCRGTKVFGAWEFRDWVISEVGHSH